MTQRMFCKYYPEPNDLRVEDGGGAPAATDPGAESQAEAKGSGITRGKQLSLILGPATLVWSQLLLRKGRRTGLLFVELRRPSA